MTRREMLRTMLAGLLGLSVPSRSATRCVLRVKDMHDSDYLARYHFGRMRGHSALGNEVEGPLVDVGGWRQGSRFPRPRLVWGNGDAFQCRSATVLGFLRDALPLPESQSWDRHLRGTYRTLLGWFFADWDGHAWISTIPLKPKSDRMAAVRGTCIESLPRCLEPKGRRGRVNLACGLPDLLLDPSSFAYDRPERHEKTQFFRVVKKKTAVCRPSRNYPQGRKYVLGFDHSVCLVEPGADDAVLLRGGGMARTFYDPGLTLYTCPHVWFCKVIDGSPPHVHQLAISLHPGDGRPFSLKTEARPLPAVLQQQVIDGLMLRQAGVWCE